MQVYEQSSISGTTVTLTSAQLGYDPSDYTHHIIGVSGLATPASDTWNLEVKPTGASAFYYVATSTPNGGSFKLDAFKIEAVRITFSASASSAALTVQSVTRKAFIDL